MEDECLNVVITEGNLGSNQTELKMLKFSVLAFGQRPGFSVIK